MSDVTQTTESVSITIDADGNGWTQIAHALAEVSSPTVIEGGGTATLTPVEGQPSVTCINVVSAPANTTVSVQVTITPESPSVDEPEAAPAGEASGSPDPLANAPTAGEQSAPSAEQSAGELEQVTQAQDAANAETTAALVEQEATATSEQEQPSAADIEASHEHEHDLATSDAEPAGQSDVGPQAGGTKASEDAGVADQAGSPSEEPSELAKLLAELDEDFDAVEDGADLDKIVDLLGEALAGKIAAKVGIVAKTTCPICQHEFVPGTPVA